MNLLRHPQRFFLRRTILLGTSVFVLSMFAGIALMFWREYSNNLLRMPSSIAARLLLQAVVGPIYMGLAFLWPITLPVLLVLVIMTYIGSQLRRIWLSLAAFLLMGLYWLWMVELIADGAFD
jgi:hypothetical protein